MKFKQRAQAVWRALGGKLWEGSEGIFGHPHQHSGAIRSESVAKTLSPFSNALQIYQSQIGRFPLPVYRRDDAGGREKARENPAFRILGDRPNNGQSRPSFWHKAIEDFFIKGEFFAFCQRSVGGVLQAIYHIPACSVIRVERDAQWKKTYYVMEADGERNYRHDEVIHCTHYFNDGLRGTPFLAYAGESLGLHRQVLESANAFYRNAAKPSGVLKHPNKLLPEARNELKDGFKRAYQGVGNTGEIPILDMGVDFVALPSTTAEDARIIEALGTSVGDVARWFNLDPLNIGGSGQPGATHSNLGASNTSLYQRSIAPVVDLIEAELNHILFPDDDDLYAEFVVESLLRGDPLQQAQIGSIGIQAGYLLRSEQREMLNLPYVAGLDVPLAPMNMGAPSVINMTAQSEGNNAPNKE